MESTRGRRVISTCTLVCLLLIFVIESNAYVPDWLVDMIYEVTVDPEKIYYRSSTGVACPFEYNEVDDIIEGELIRSRIKPIYWTNRLEESEAILVLDVQANCLERDNLNPVFDVDVYFALYRFVDGLYSGSFLADWEFGSFGIGDHDYILQSVEDAVEDAITAYVKANFDL